MAQRAALRSRSGLLLLEAVLSAVVIAVGLVGVSQGLGSQLRALETVEAYETLMSLAHNQLTELEQFKLARPAQPIARSGVFAAPHQQYRWAIDRVTPRDGPGDLADASGPLTSNVTFTVSRTDRPRSASLTLQVVWPAAWFPPS